MLCPYCNSNLIAEQGIFICPNFHGTLMSGQLLGNINHINVDDSRSSSTNDSLNKKILCPNCHNEMEKVNYNDTGILIDSCPNCPYRWLDRGEISKIKLAKPKINPNDLIFLSDLQSTTQAIAPNPNLYNTTLVNPWVESFVEGVAAGNESKTLGLLGGLATYSLTKVMIKSKFFRVIDAIFIIFFIILGYLILKQLKLISK
jgi:Zn-finger nucleic acid-binding protein